VSLSRRHVRLTLAVGAAAVIMLAMAVPSDPAHATDSFDALRAKVVASLTGGGSSTSADADVRARVAAIDTEAAKQWSSMDKSSTRTTLWTDVTLDDKVDNRASLSYGRLEAMALAWATPGSADYGNASLLADTISGLDWITSTWYNPTVQRNSHYWYYTEVSAPTNLLDATALLYGQLTVTQVQSYVAAVDHFVPTPKGFTGDYVAANRAWKSYVVMMSGIISKNSTKLVIAKSAISQLFAYVPSGDGFYVDGSFIQHSWYAYSGSYGVSLLARLATLLDILDGSTWEVTDVAQANIYTWIYATFEPIVFNGILMDAFRGRENSRYQNQDVNEAGTLMGALTLLTETAPTTQVAQLKSMIKYQAQTSDASYLYPAMAVSTIVYLKSVIADATVSPRGPLTKYVEYPSEDRAVQSRPTWAYTIGLHSQHSKNYETISDENKRGWYTGDGMTYLYTADDPNSFDGSYWATVNPYRLPGTTSDQAPVANSSGVSEPWDTSMHWTGGSSIDGQYGTQAMYLQAEQSDLHAKKAWFMFDDEVVALGSGITATDGNEIDTTVENRKLDPAGDNAVQVNGVSTSTALAAPVLYTGVNSIYLAGTGGYYFPTATTVQSHRYARSAAWSDVNGLYTDAGNPTHTDDYLELYLNHGTSPVGKSYAYVTLPNATAAQTTAYAANPDVTILENSTAASAASDSTIGVAGYDFWNNSSYTVNGVKVDKSASVMTKTATGSLAVSVSDPTQENTGTINVELATSAVSVASLPPTVTVTQLSPTIKFSVNVAGTHGRDVTVSFRTSATGTTTTGTGLTPWPILPTGPIATSTAEDITAAGAVPAGWSAILNGEGTIGEQIYRNSGNWFEHSTKFTKTGTGHGMYLRRTFAASGPTVGITAYLTPAQTTSNWRMIVSSGSVEAIKVVFASNGTITANGVATGVSYTADTPYLVEIKANTSTDTFDLYIDTVKRATGIAFENAVSSLDSQEFSAYSLDVGTLYLDELRVYNYGYSN
jgi:hyaluronate lyase